MDAKRGSPSRKEKGPVPLTRAPALTKRQEERFARAPWDKKLWSRSQVPPSCPEALGQHSCKLAFAERNALCRWHGKSQLIFFLLLLFRRRLEPCPTLVLPTVAATATTPPPTKPRSSRPPVASWSSTTERRLQRDPVLLATSVDRHSRAYVPEQAFPPFSGQWIRGRRCMSFLLGSRDHIALGSRRPSIRTADLPEWQCLADFPFFAVYCPRLCCLCAAV